MSIPITICENSPSISSPISAENLNKISQSINLPIVLDRIMEKGIHAYSGGLDTISQDANADRTLVYYNSDSSLVSYKVVMWFDGLSWSNISGGMTIDDISEYLSYISTEDVKNLAIIVGRMVIYGLTAFDGGLDTINVSQTVDVKKVYYNSKTTSPSYKLIMWHNGTRWVDLNGMTTDNFPEYSNYDSVSESKNFARVMDRIIEHGIYAYSGGVTTINQDTHVNTNYVYYNSNSSTASYKVVMWYDGTKWRTFNNSLTIDDIPDYINLNPVSDIRSTLSSSDAFNVSLTWESGNINGGTGEKESSTNTIRSELVPVNDITLISATVDSGFTYAVRGYSDNEIAGRCFVYTHAFINTETIYFDQLPSNCKYLAFCLRKNGIATSDSSHIHIKRIKSFKNVKEFVDEKTANVSFIDDETTSSDKTWSSSKVNGLIYEINNDIANIESIIDAPVSVTDDLANKIRQLLKYNRSKKFLNLCFLTDTHSNIENGHFAINSLQALQTVKVCDGYVHGGDIITTYDYGFAEYVKQMEQNIGNYKKNGEIFFVKGNHDNNHSNSQYDNATKPQYKQLAQISMNNAIFNASNNNTCYYYFDYPNEKVRCIVLDSYSIENDSVTVNIDSEQNSWLYNTALDVENGWTVVVFSHQFTDVLTDTIDILNAFADRGTTYGNYEFDTDISTQFVGVIHGHTHQDEYSNILGFNNIGVTKAFGESDADGALSLFTIDTTDHILYETRIGDGYDRSYSFDTPGRLS